MWGSQFYKDLKEHCILHTVAQKGNLVISADSDNVPFAGRVINIVTMSGFSTFISTIVDINETFEICEKLELLQELLLHNFYAKLYHKEIYIMIQ